MEIQITKMLKFSVFLAAVLSLSRSDASVSVHDPFYCYFNDPIRPQVGMFSIISTYETSRGRSIDPNVSNCTPSKFWLVSRHGTRLPNEADIQNMIDMNERLKADILRNYIMGRTSLCAADMEMIRNWQFDSNITVARQQYLTVTGWNEFQGLGQRYQKAFPILLPSTYSPNDFFFRTAFTQRAVGSIRAFSDGLFGFNGWQQVQFEPIPSLDFLLRPHDFCVDWNNVTSVSVEQDAFIERPEFQEMLNQVSAKLGFFGSNQLRQLEIETLANICKFEQIWNINSLSPFCAAFSVANHQVMEYRDDLFSFYRFGYGHTEHRKLFENINCFLMQDLLKYFVSNNPTDHKARIFGGHTATMQLILVTLGVYKDSVPLTRHNFAQQTFRQWRTSLLSMKGSNLVVVRYDCPDGDNDVLFLHNEKPLQIDGCKPNGLCKLNMIIEKFSRFLNAQCEENFCSNK